MDEKISGVIEHGRDTLDADVADNYLKAREALAVLERKMINPRLPQDFATLAIARAAVVQAGAAVLDLGGKPLERVAFALFAQPETEESASNVEEVQG